MDFYNLIKDNIAYFDKKKENFQNYFEDTKYSPLDDISSRAFSVVSEDNEISISTNLLELLVYTKLRDSAHFDEFCSFLCAALSQKHYKFICFDGLNLKITEPCFGWVRQKRSIFRAEEYLKTKLVRRLKKAKIKKFFGGFDPKELQKPLKQNMKMYPVEINVNPDFPANLFVLSSLPIIRSLTEMEKNSNIGPKLDSSIAQIVLKLLHNEKLTFEQTGSDKCKTFMLSLLRLFDELFHTHSVTKKLNDFYILVETMEIADLNLYWSEIKGNTEIILAEILLSLYSRSFENIIKSISPLFLLSFETHLNRGAVKKKADNKTKKEEENESNAIHLIQQNMQKYSETLHTRPCFNCEEFMALDMFSEKEDLPLNRIVYGKIACDKDFLYIYKFGVFQKIAKGEENLKGKTYSRVEQNFKVDSLICYKESLFIRQIDHSRPGDFLVQLDKNNFEPLRLILFQTESTEPNLVLQVACNSNSIVALVRTMNDGQTDEKYFFSFFDLNVRNFDGGERIQKKIFLELNNGGFSASFKTFELPLAVSKCVRTAPFDFDLLQMPSAFRSGLNLSKKYDKLHNPNFMGEFKKGDRVSVRIKTGWTEGIILSTLYQMVKVRIGSNESSFTEWYFNKSINIALNRPEINPRSFKAQPRALWSFSSNNGKLIRCGRNDSQLIENAFENDSQFVKLHIWNRKVVFNFIKMVMIDEKGCEHRLHRKLLDYKISQQINAVEDVVLFATDQKFGILVPNSTATFKQQNSLLHVFDLSPDKTCNFRETQTLGKNETYSDFAFDRTIGQLIQYDGVENKVNFFHCSALDTDPNFMAICSNEYSSLLISVLAFLRVLAIKTPEETRRFGLDFGDNEDASFGVLKLTLCLAKKLSSQLNQFSEVDELVFSLTTLISFKPSELDEKKSKMADILFEFLLTPISSKTKNSIIKLLKRWNPSISKENKIVFLIEKCINSFSIGNKGPILQPILEGFREILHFLENKSLKTLATKCSEEIKGGPEATKIYFYRILREMYNSLYELFAVDVREFLWELFMANYWLWNKQDVFEGFTLNNAMISDGEFTKLPARKIGRISLFLKTMFLDYPNLTSNGSPNSNEHVYKGDFKGVFRFKEEINLQTSNKKSPKTKKIKQENAHFILLEINIDRKTKIDKKNPICVVIYTKIKQETVIIESASSPSHVLSNTNYCYIYAYCLRKKFFKTNLRVTTYYQLETKPASFPLQLCFRLSELTGDQLNLHKPPLFSEKTTFTDFLKEIEIDTDLFFLEKTTQRLISDVRKLDFKDLERHLPVCPLYINKETFRGLALNLTHTVTNYLNIKISLTELNSQNSNLPKTVLKVISSLLSHFLALEFHEKCFVNYLDIHREDIQLSEISQAMEETLPANTLIERTLREEVLGKDPRAFFQSRKDGQSILDSISENILSIKTLFDDTQHTFSSLEKSALLKEKTALLYKMGAFFKNCCLVQKDQIVSRIHYELKRIDAANFSLTEMSELMHAALNTKHQCTIFHEILLRNWEKKSLDKDVLNSKRTFSAQKEFIKAAFRVVEAILPRYRDSDNSANLTLEKILAILLCFKEQLVLSDFGRIVGWSDLVFTSADRILNVDYIRWKEHKALSKIAKKSVLRFAKLSLARFLRLERGDGCMADLSAVVEKKFLVEDKRAEKTLFRKRNRFLLELRTILLRAQKCFCKTRSKFMAEHFREKLFSFTLKTKDLRLMRLSCKLLLEEEKIAEDGYLVEYLAKAIARIGELNQWKQEKHEQSNTNESKWIEHALSQTKKYQTILYGEKRELQDDIRYCKKFQNLFLVSRAHSLEDFLKNCQNYTEIIAPKYIKSISEATANDRLQPHQKCFKPKLISSLATNNFTVLYTGKKSTCKSIAARISKDGFSILVKAVPGNTFSDQKLSEIVWTEDCCSTKANSLLSFELRDFVLRLIRANSSALDLFLLTNQFRHFEKNFDLIYGASFVFKNSTGLYQKGSFQPAKKNLKSEGTVLEEKNSLVSLFLDNRMRFSLEKRSLLKSVYRKESVLPRNLFEKFAQIACLILEENSSKCPLNITRAILLSNLLEILFQQPDTTIDQRDRENLHAHLITLSNSNKMHPELDIRELDQKLQQAAFALERLNKRRIQEKTKESLGTFLDCLDKDFLSFDKITPFFVFENDFCTAEYVGGNKYIEKDLPMTITSNQSITDGQYAEITIARKKPNDICAIGLCTKEVHTDSQQPFGFSRGSFALFSDGKKGHFSKKSKEIAEFSDVAIGDVYDFQSQIDPVVWRRAVVLAKRDDKLKVDFVDTPNGSPVWFPFAKRVMRPYAAITAALPGQFHFEPFEWGFAEGDVVCVLIKGESIWIKRNNSPFAELYKHSTIARKTSGENFFLAVSLTKGTKVTLNCGQKDFSFSDLAPKRTEPSLQLRRQLPLTSRPENSISFLENYIRLFLRQMNDDNRAAVPASLFMQHLRPSNLRMECFFSPFNRIPRDFIAQNSFGIDVNVENMSALDDDSIVITTLIKEKVLKNTVYIGDEVKVIKASSSDFSEFLRSRHPLSECGEWTAETAAITNCFGIVRAFARRNTVVLVEFRPSEAKKTLFCWLPLSVCAKQQRTEMFSREKSREKVELVFEEALQQKILRLSSKLLCSNLSLAPETKETRLRRFCATNRRFLRDFSCHRKILENCSELNLSDAAAVKLCQRTLASAKKIFFEKKTTFISDSDDIKPIGYFQRKGGPILVFKKHFFFEGVEAICFKTPKKFFQPEGMSLIFSGDENCEEVLAEIKDQKLFFPLKFERQSIWLFCVLNDLITDLNQKLTLELSIFSVPPELTFGIWLFVNCVKKVFRTKERCSDQEEKGEIRKKLANCFQTILEIYLNADLSIYLWKVFSRIMSIYTTKNEHLFEDKKSVDLLKELSRKLFNLGDMECESHADILVHSELFQNGVETIVGALICAESKDSHSLAFERMFRLNFPAFNDLAKLLGRLIKIVCPLGVASLSSFETPQTANLKRYEQMARLIQTHLTQTNLKVDQLGPKEMEIIANKFKFWGETQNSPPKRDAIETILKDLRLILDLNQNVSLLYKVNMNDGIFVKAIKPAKNLFLLEKKKRFVASVMEATSIFFSKQKLKIERLVSSDNSKGSLVFHQLHKLLKNVPDESMCVPSGLSAFQVVFENESAVGTHGPYREVFESVFEELFSVSSHIGLFEPTPNFTDKIGEDRYLFVPTKNPQRRKSLYEFVGKLIGIAFRGNLCVPLCLPDLFFKMLCDEPSGRRELEQIDFSICTSQLSVLENCESQGDLDLLCIDISFSKDLNPFIALHLRGEKVTFQNRLHFVSAMQQKLLRQYEKGLKIICDGFCKIVPKAAISFLRSEEVRNHLGGSPSIDVNLLERNTIYKNCTKNDPFVKHFWSAFKKFSEREKSRFVQFAFASSRLPKSNAEFQARKIRMQIEPLEAPEGRDLRTVFPRAETCFFNVSIPRYSDEAIMAEMLEKVLRFGWGMSGDDVVFAEVESGRGGEGDLRQGRDLRRAENTVTVILHPQRTQRQGGEGGSEVVGLYSEEESNVRISSEENDE